MVRVLGPKDLPEPKSGNIQAGLKLGLANHVRSFDFERFGFCFHLLAGGTPSRIWQSQADPLDGFILGLCSRRTFYVGA